MIRSFRCRDTEALFNDRDVRQFRNIERMARRKGQHSIRVNNQWRICFRWKDSDALDVEIVDYH